MTTGTRVDISKYGSADKHGHTHDAHNSMLSCTSVGLETQHRARSCPADSPRPSGLPHQMCSQRDQGPIPNLPPLNSEPHFSFRVK